MTLSQIEAEAKRLLIRRRQSLGQGPVPPPGDPAAKWTDYEGAPAPMAEETRREMAAIDEALGRIAQGRYGSCLACGGALGLQRIRAIPEARYCVACSGERREAE